MGRITIRDLICVIKYKASQSKAAALQSKLQLSLLSATTHDPSTPPVEKHLNTFLSFGHCPRATAATAIKALVDRLQNTQDSSVALKCLIIIHHIIKQGSFILQDQLSVYTSSGGRNYLKLSGFRDNSTALNWDLSCWVRWYARYLETLLATSKILGFFICSSSCTFDKDKAEEKVSTLCNNDLHTEFDSLVNLFEEICKRPNSLWLHANKIVDEIIVLVSEDYVSALNVVMLRVNEFKERLNSLSFAESVEFVCALKRLADCTERLLELSTRKKALIENFWALISEMKEKAGTKKVSVDEGRLLITLRKTDRASESARFLDRSGNSVRFSSGRFA